MNTVEQCIDDMISVQLGDILQDNITELPDLSEPDFDGMYEEIDKRKLVL